MTDAQSEPEAPSLIVIRGTHVDPKPDVVSGAGGDGGGETISSPAKVLRIGAMTKQLLDEVRRAPLDEAGRGRLREIYETSVRELGDVLSGELKEELARLTSPFDSDTPSEAELRVAQAQLVGWLEGLFHGIQATLFTQQMAAQQQLEEMRRRGLPAGPTGSDSRPAPVSICEPWRGRMKRVRGAALVGALVLGLREVFDRPREPVPMVVDFAGDPPALEPITLFFHPEVPEATLVLLLT